MGVYLKEAAKAEVVPQQGRKQWSLVNIGF
jgi:hypothetical protein